MVASIFASQQPAFRNPYDPDAVALFARMTAQPNNGRKKLISDTIVSLKTAGVWDKLSALYFPAAHDAQSASLNWKSATYTLVPANSPVFTTDKGYAGDGTGAYLATGINLVTDPLYLLSSAHMGVFVNGTNFAGSDTQAPIGALPSFVVTRGEANTIRARINSATTSSIGGVVATRVGHSLAARTDNANISAYKDGGAPATVASGLATILADPVFLLAVNSGGFPISFSPERIASASVGGGLTAIEVTSLYTATFNYLSAIGAQV